MRRLAAALFLSCALTGCGGAPPSVRTQDAPVRGAFHEDRPYRLQNSFRGLRLAARTDTWIDIDSNYCWDAGRRHRVPLATHWASIDRDRFIDPAGRIPSDAAFADLTLPQVRRLRSTDPVPHRIHTMEEMVREAARVGLEGIEWEIKGGKGFENPAIYRPVLAVAADVGVEINVKSLANIGGTRAALRRLEAAHRAGATTMLQYHSGPPVRITERQSRFLDYVRGEWRPASG